MGQLSTGDLFGEQSALNDLPNPYSIVAASNKVEYYRIHRVNFNQFFSGAQGDQINEMRAQIILKNNWLCSKFLQMEEMNADELWKLEYCNDADLSKSKPTKTTIKEVPFLKNNPH